MLVCYTFQPMSRNPPDGGLGIVAVTSGKTKKQNQKRCPLPLPSFGRRGSGALEVGWAVVEKPLLGQGSEWGEAHQTEMVSGMCGPLDKSQEHKAGVGRDLLKEANSPICSFYRKGN